MIAEATFGAVILAAGRSRRMGTEINKVYLGLGGKPVLLHSLEKFIDFPLVEEYVLVVDEQDHPLLEERVFPRLESAGRVSVVEGGQRRQDSSWAGLRQISSDYVFVHDAARPNFSTGLLERLAESAVEYGAAIPGISPVDTIRRVDDDWARSTVDRDSLARIQTPQCFRTTSLRDSLREAQEASRYFTDDAGALMAIGGERPKVVQGERYNLKLTTPEDLDFLVSRFENNHNSSEEIDR